MYSNIMPERPAFAEFVQFTDLIDVLGQKACHSMDE